MIADSLVLRLLKTHDCDVISDHFYTFQIGQFLLKGTFELFWRKAYAEGHPKITKAAKGRPERCQFAGFIKTDWIKAVFCV